MLHWHKGVLYHSLFKFNKRVYLFSKVILFIPFSGLILKSLVNKFQILLLAQFSFVAAL